MNINRAKILQFQDDKGNSYYGGDQSWFSSNTHALAGCSSVSGANVLRMLARTNSDFNKDIENSHKIPSQVKSAICSQKANREFFDILMTGMYKTMGAMEVFPFNRIYDKKERNSKFLFHIPPNMGQTNTGFIIGIIRFARKMGVNISVKHFNTAFASKENARKFIEEGLQKAGSVVMLTSYNKHPVRIYPAASNFDKPLEAQPGSYDASIKCHFTTITDIDGDRLLITTWGKPAVGDMNVITKSWKSIKAFESTLMYIEPSTKKESNISLLLSFVPFVKGILQTIIRHAF